MKNITFSLCCGKAKCPVVSKIDGDDWSIKDDFGGSVILTTGQLKELIEKSQEVFSIDNSKKLIHNED